MIYDVPDDEISHCDGGFFLVTLNLMVSGRKLANMLKVEGVCKGVLCKELNDHKM